MIFPTSWLRRSKPRKNRSGRQLGIEPLEDRSLLNAGSPSSVIDLSGLAVNPGQYSSSDILVQFKSAALSGQGVPALPGTFAGQQLSLVPGLYAIQLDPGVTVAGALAAYRADAQVVQASPDYSLATSVYPNDPQFNQQWALLNTGQAGGTAGDDIGITHAWSVTTGSAKTLVAVMDTGIDYDQPDLYQNIWINQAEIPKSRLAPSLGGTNPNGIQDYYHDGYVSWRDLNDPRNIGPGKVMNLDGASYIDPYDILAPMTLNAQGQDTGYGGWAYPGNTQDGDTAHPNDFIGWNFVNNTNNPFDGNGHGTHVAGIIGATGNNGVGVAGINWQVSLMPVEFLNASGTGSISAFIAGLNYAVQHGAKISNNSWSGANDDPLLLAAISNARTAGMIFVAAAGNGGSDNDNTPAYPSSFNLNNVISVAAVDNNFQLASFSNYGPHSVDLAAPGVNILSTLPNNSYGTLSGTSMATPMVTGVAALVWNEHPDWTYQQVINQILTTVDPVPGLQGKVLTGGVLDAARAVGYNAPQTTAPSTLQVLSSSASGSSANTLNTIDLTFNLGVNPAALNNTNVALFGPNGQRIMFQSFQAVAGTGNTQIELTFPTQTASGTYTLLLATGIPSISGPTLPATYQNTFSLSSSFLFTSNVPVGIPDVSQTSATLTVPQSLTIGSLTVTLNMVNSVDGKMVLTLVAPDGTSVLLSNLRGGSGTGFLNTTFDDQANTSIQSGQAPFTGSYQPETPLSNLVGKNAQGTWKLFVVDHSTNYYVVLTSWSLTITGPGGSTSIAAVPSAPLGAKAAALAPAESTVRARLAALAMSASELTLGNSNGLRSDSPATDPQESDPPRATQAADEVFASLEGIDRLAEIRTMYPHGSRMNDLAGEVVSDDPTEDGDGTDVVAVSWLDN